MGINIKHTDDSQCAGNTPHNHRCEHAILNEKGDGLATNSSLPVVSTRLKCSECLANKILPCNLELDENKVPEQVITELTRKALAANIDI